MNDFTSSFLGTIIGLQNIQANEIQRKRMELGLQFEQQKVRQNDFSTDFDASLHRTVTGQNLDPISPEGAAYLFSDLKTDSKRHFFKANGVDPGDNTEFRLDWTEVGPVVSMMKEGQLQGRAVRVDQASFQRAMGDNYTKSMAPGMFATAQLFSGMQAPAGQAPTGLAGQAPAPTGPAPTATPMSAQVSAEGAPASEVVGSFRSPAAKRAGRLGVPFSPETMADVAGWEAIEEQRLGLPKGIMASLRRVESASVHGEAVSPKGARGLYQIMPSTAADPGYNIKPLKNWDDLRDQTRFAAEYLAKMRDVNGGALDRALASYNAGPGAVQKAKGVPQYDGVPQYVANVAKGIPSTPGAESAKKDANAIEAAYRGVKFPGEASPTGASLLAAVPTAVPTAAPTSSAPKSYGLGKEAAAAPAGSAPAPAPASTSDFSSVGEAFEKKGLFGGVVPHLADRFSNYREENLAKERTRREAENERLNAAGAPLRKFFYGSEGEAEHQAARKEAEEAKMAPEAKKKGLNVGVVEALAGPAPAPTKPDAASAPASAPSAPALPPAVTATLGKSEVTKDEVVKSAPQISISAPPQVAVPQAVETLRTPEAPTPAKRLAALYLYQQRIIDADGVVNYFRTGEVVNSQMERLKMAEQQARTLQAQEAVEAQRYGMLNTQQQMGLRVDQERRAIEAQEKQRRDEARTNRKELSDAIDDLVKEQNKVGNEFGEMSYEDAQLLRADALRAADLAGFNPRDLRHRALFHQAYNNFRQYNAAQKKKWWGGREEVTALPFLLDAVRRGSKANVETATQLVEATDATFAAFNVPLEKVDMATRQDVANYVQAFLERGVDPKEVPGRIQTVMEAIKRNPKIADPKSPDYMNAAQIADKLEAHYAEASK